MIIAPVIFLTIVAGIAKIGDLRHVGKIGLKALIYFEVLTTLALVEHLRRWRQGLLGTHDLLTPM